MRLFVPMLSVALAAIAFACSDDDSGGGSPATSSTTAGTGGDGTGAVGGGGSSDGGGGAGNGGMGGAQGDTWGNFAQGFFATYCVECHGVGDKLRDYTTIDDVKTDNTTIRCGVAPATLQKCTGSPKPKQFPIDNATKDNPKPTDEERTRLVAWIEAGMLE